MKSVLVHDGRHERPMLAVLERYCIGAKDKYNRGRWITENDIDKISEGMKADPTLIWDRYVQGTNAHNHVCIEEFIELFQ